VSESKVLTTHLQRQAIIYVRQSSLYQVENHTESRHRQYQLTERAQRLGWAVSQCLVIDEDQGISAAHQYNRPGYQRLVSMIALREVGILLGLEVSRLARNSLHMYQLLELAAAFDVLIADEDCIYNPADFNDRLLLGLKGTISEVELYQIRARLVRGRLSKARRGELVWRLPVGLDRDPLTQQIRLAIDESIRHLCELVFHRFEQLHSIRAVLHSLRRDGLELPYRQVHRLTGERIGWRQPSYDALYAILTNPMYAGVYCYGRKQRQFNPLTQTAHVAKIADRDQWEAFLPEHHPGYISFEKFEENLRILANNRNLYPGSQGAARRGTALLQGLVYCQHCGNKMRLSYESKSAYYVCAAAHKRFGSAICNRASARRVDDLVAELFLTVINTETVKQSVSYDQQLREEAALRDRSGYERLQRLEYEADLARRRYELVDPANRLVAHTLESEWNDKLIELEGARKVYEARRWKEYKLTSTLAEIEEVVAHLREHWYADAISDQDRKELLRCLIEHVHLERCGKIIRARIGWYGGAVSELEVPKYIFSAPAVYHRIRALAREHTDSEIAARLNQERVTTVKGKEWTARRVMDFRRSNEIASGFTTAGELRVNGSGYYTSAEAADQLGVKQGAIQRWYKLGLLAGKHDGGQAALWIALNEDVLNRLGGKAKPDARMVSVRSLCEAQKKRPDEVLKWAQAEGHEIYRLRRGSTLRFYVLPK
jgi:DNA invertase Pin-like site-specific DNA recombinase